MRASSVVIALVFAGCAAPPAPSSKSPTPIATPTIAPGETRAIVIDDPVNRWAREGFVELAPTIRVSVGAGGNTETRIFARWPSAAPITVDAAGLLMFPPGSELDRVSFVLGPGALRRIDDVRGTRWDDAGVELFHVYLPSDERPGSPLAGVEWRRGDHAAQRLATKSLVAWARAHAAPPDGSTMDDEEASHFARLNECQRCHRAAKPEASDDDDRAPPWPTDGRGLYVPMAVFADHAVLSNSPSFDDPNAGDRFLRARCAKGPATLEGGAGDHWFSCPDGVPIGERDLAAAMRARDDYAARTCSARRALVEHMDATARAHFAQTLEPCGGDVR